MYLIPLIRLNRAVSCCLLFPEYPIQSIATSEIISYIGPFINYPPFDINLIGFTIYFIYDNSYAKEIIKIYKDKNKVLYQIELMLLFLFILGSLSTILGK